MARCPYCRREVRESDRFCAHDGKPLVRARFEPAVVRAYLAEGDAYTGHITVHSLGTNPLRLQLRPDSSSLALATTAFELGPHETRTVEFTVRLGQSSGAHAAIEVRSNESTPTVSRIPVEIERPPQLELELVGGAIYYDVPDYELRLRHVGGGTSTIESAYCEEEWASIFVPAGHRLAGGDEVLCQLQVETRFLSTLEQGERVLSVVVHLNGALDQTLRVRFRLQQRHSLIAAPVRVSGILPHRRTEAQSVIRNAAETPVTIRGIHAPGLDWLRVKARFPFEIPPGEKRAVRLDIVTPPQGGITLAGTLSIQWGRDDLTDVPVTVQVTDPPEYEGYIGIDFGTTNSCVCLSRPGDLTAQPDLVPLESLEGEPLYVVPTVVYFPNPADLQDVVVGRRAAEQAWLPEDSEHVVRQVKRLLGKPQALSLHGQRILPEAVAARFLRYLIDRAEDHVRQRIKRAIVTVPPIFSSRQMHALLSACRMAGLQAAELVPDWHAALEKGLLDVLDEPVAAALDYVESDPGPDLSDARILIVDFGGGTLDVSVVHVQRSAEAAALQVSVLAGAGTELGGEDLTDLLVQRLAQRLRDLHHWRERELPYRTQGAEWDLLDPQQKDQVRFNAQSLREHAEQIKRRLTELPGVDNYEMPVMAGLPPKMQHVKISLARAEFEALIRPRLEGALEVVQDALDFAHLAPGDLSRAILTGGSSRIPLVRTLLENRLGVPVEIAPRPKECVARGAFRLGSYRQGVEAGVMKTLGLHSRTCTRYGIMVQRPGGSREFAEVIPLGQALPTPWFQYPDATRPDHLSLKVGSKALEVKVVQNRSRRDRPQQQDLAEVGRVRLPDTLPMEPATLTVKMQLDYYRRLSVKVFIGEREVEAAFSDL